MTATTRRRIGTLSLALVLGSANAAVAQREARDDESTITDSRVQHRTYTMHETTWTRMPSGTSRSSCSTAQRTGRSPSSGPATQWRG